MSIKDVALSLCRDYTFRENGHLDLTQGYPWNHRQFLRNDIDRRQRRSRRDDRMPDPGRDDRSVSG